MKPECNKFVEVICLFLILGVLVFPSKPVFAEEESFDDAFDPVLKQLDEPIVNEDTGPEVKAKLEGIGIGGEKSFAIINGDIYRVGEQKDGIRVTQIRRKQVDIVVNGATKHLSLSGIGVKKEESSSDQVSPLGIAEENSVEVVDSAVQTVETSTEAEEEIGKKEIVNEVQKVVSTIVGVKNDDIKK